MVPILEESGLKSDKDFYFRYSPEREYPNNMEYNIDIIAKN